MHVRIPAVAAAALFCLTAACAPTPGSYVLSGDLPQADRDAFAAVVPVIELTCTGGGRTCTSKYAFPCPDGWTPCALTGENKTCCRKTASAAPPDDLSAVRPG